MSELMEGILFLILLTLGIFGLATCSARESEQTRKENKAECQAMGGTFVQVMDSRKALYDSCALP